MNGKQVVDFNMCPWSTSKKNLVKETSEGNKWRKLVNEKLII